MPHPAGERLRCDECGAEILFVKPCPCPDREPRAHSDICCGQEMRIVERGATAGASEASPAH